MPPLDATSPRLLLRLEGAMALLLALLLYATLGAGWWLFVALFLLPDLAILGYLLNPTVGSRAYNAVHTYVVPGALFGLGFATGRGTVMAVALIWIAHLGLDRALGFGLKYANRPFRETHLQQT